eukprot:3941690-Rhodomonas_salina.3
MTTGRPVEVKDEGQVSCEIKCITAQAPYILYQEGGFLAFDFGGCAVFGPDITCRRRPFGRDFPPYAMSGAHLAYAATAARRDVRY